MCGTVHAARAQVAQTEPASVIRRGDAMSVQGLRVHIAGSAARSADRSLLEAAHEFASVLTERLIGAGAGLVLGAGEQPLGDEGLPCTFDWTALEAIAATPDPGPEWPINRPGRFCVVASQRALDKIPQSRRGVWAECTGRTDFQLELSEPGWRMGGVIRAAQVLRGDVLVVLGGGAGPITSSAAGRQVAHLAGWPLFEAQQFGATRGREPHRRCATRGSWCVPRATPPQSRPRRLLRSPSPQP